MDETLAHWINI